MGHVSGIGGAFVFSSDPKKLADWYSEHFGFVFEGSEEFGAFYQVFRAIDADRPGKLLDTTFAVMRAKLDLPRAEGELDDGDMYGDQHFMLNIRVIDMNAVLAHLERMQIPILGSSDEPYGRFAWVRDADGNRIELYEPVADSAAEGS